MGCDIHAFAEKQAGERWIRVRGISPFDWRSYGLFGFLADIRNYSAVPPIAPRRELPRDVSEAVQDEYERWSGDAHSATWLSVAELLVFDYDQEFEDRRYTRQEGPNFFNGGATCEPGQGKKTTYREFLGPAFFKDLDKLKEAGAERVVFWFDN